MKNVFQSFGSDGVLTVSVQGARRRVARGEQVLLEVEQRTSSGSGDEQWTLAAVDGSLAGRPEQVARVLMAAAESLFATEDRRGVELYFDVFTALADYPVRCGFAWPRSGGRVYIDAASLWQQPQLWLPHATDSFPKTYVMSGDKRHPQRPAKPQGIVYERWIPWLQQALSFRAATLDDDLDMLHRWMNDPRVAYFWNEEGDLAHHRNYLEGILADPHMIPLIGSFDGEPFGYFEIYWARENRIAPFYDVGDYDRGWHVLVGNPDFRGREYISAWMSSIVHYLFLDDCRTQRIVGEPRADHEQQIRNLQIAGFSVPKYFQFPHKRAALVSLLRERYFEDRLWLPAFAKTGAVQSMLTATV